MTCLGHQKHRPYQASSTNCVFRKISDITFIANMIRSLSQIKSKVNITILVLSTSRIHIARITMSIKVMIGH